VHALGGAPGVHSARYAGEPKSDRRNNEKLIADLAGIPNRCARYVCVLVFVPHADDPQPIIAEGEWSGEIIDVPRGEGGFGYDPYFFVPDAGRTAAQFDPAEKNRRSHRGQALFLLAERLKTRGA
jgi:XTP/dITP diphosphohydrolase